MVAKALDAAEALAKEGIQATVVNIHTIKPIDEELIVNARRNRPLWAFRILLVNLVHQPIC